MAQEIDQQPLHRGGSDIPPKKKTCTGFCCYKCLVVLYSLLFLLIGICLFGIGVYVGKVKADYDSINDALTAPVILAVVLGLFMVIFAFLGLIGAAKNKLILLKIFFGIAIVVFIGQVIIGILAYIYREEGLNVVSKQLVTAVETYGTDGGVTRGVNHIQTEFKCCGLKDPSVWERSDIYKCGGDDPAKACGVPDSCCIEYSEGCGHGVRHAWNSTAYDANIYEKGCTDKFRNWLEFNLDVVGATALALTLLHVLGIFFTYFFITAVQDRVWLFGYRKKYYLKN